ncbi:low molecular weight protein-tyrosine-phosphatase [Thalassolituus sp. ST750PaO-4]|uniref:low molecular weight protein-tyrosine-phosphatase n=1 Tax=Thalassolituus sp. ST750PaO-4 TaxID=2742965 RepID=UPI001CE30FC5
MLRVLFVCLGNICRSPTADGVFRSMVASAGLSDQVEVDSAGTAAWHIGKTPDPRTIKAAAERGYDLSVLRARQALAADFDQFDYVLAMDLENLSNLRALKPATARTDPQLFLRSFARRFNSDEVPDPYYGGADGFEQVLDLVEDGCEGLLADIRQRLNQRAKETP